MFSFMTITIIASVLLTLLGPRPVVLSLKAACPSFLGRH